MLHSSPARVVDRGLSENFTTPTPKVLQIFSNLEDFYTGMANAYKHWKFCEKNLPPFLRYEFFKVFIKTYFFELHKFCPREKSCLTPAIQHDEHLHLCWLLTVRLRLLPHFRWCCLCQSSVKICLNLTLSPRFDGKVERMRIGRPYAWTEFEVDG